MLVAADKQTKAVELRKAGHSFATIAKLCGYADRAGAHKAVMAGLKATLDTLGETADELRQLELERLDAMLEALWPKVKRGEHGAIDRALKVGERRAALVGLDAPKKIEQKLDVQNMSDSQLDAYIAKLSAGGTGAAAECGPDRARTSPNS